MAEAVRTRPRKQGKSKKQRALPTAEEDTKSEECENPAEPLGHPVEELPTSPLKEEESISTQDFEAKESVISVQERVLDELSSCPSDLISEEPIPESTPQSHDLVIRQSPSPKRPNSLSAAVTQGTLHNNEKQTTINSALNMVSQPHSQTRVSAVEDPDTPMTRVASPPVTPRVMSPYSPSKVQEEKSSSVLAQEALAKLQSLALSNEMKSEQTTSRQSEEKVSSDTNDKAQTKVNQIPFPEPCSLKTEETTAASRHIDGNIAGQSQTTQRLVYPTQQLQDFKALEEEKSIVKIEPMSLPDLLALYYNHELLCNDAFVEDFIKSEIKRGTTHEFVEILSNYFRARNQLVGSEEDIRGSQNKYATLRESLWIVHTKNTTAQGICGDQWRVTGTHQYTQRKLDKDAVKATEKVLESIRDNIANDLCLYAYSAQLSKLQVESYIHDLYINCPALSDIPKNANIQGRNHMSPEEAWQIQRFKECISILFTFHRKPNTDAEFIDNIRKWTVRLTSSLLRVATYSDHLFVLNHLLRCPAGVGQWAAELIQCPVAPTMVTSPRPMQSNLGNPTLDHIVTALATVLLPTRAREEFMSQMRINVSDASIQEERNWILVDSDGEEDEDPSNSWLYLHENDIVAILGQLPLTQVFAPILLAQFTDSGLVDYDICRSTEPMMIQLFAFSTVLIQLFGEGLSTYSMARYRQLNKRLGRLIRQTVSFVSDHWLNFKTYYGPLMAPAGINKLQAEFDQLFMRATYKILTAQKLGSWQFMADMPYTMVSLSSLWQLLWVLHQSQGQVVDLDKLPSAEGCEAYLKDPDSWQQLADNLLRTTTSESIYLLTTFANMASCRSSDETAFIRTITLEVFEIAYICNHTREFCSKVGRELLAGIIQTHPTALSFLLTRVKSVMDKVGRMALYLFSELPIGVWQPTDPDMLILRQWLLNSSLATQENQLAQTILSKVNFDVFEQSGRLVVDMKYHRHVALLLVEAYIKYISDKRAGFFITEGMKQMYGYLAAGPSPEQAFNNWAWELALRLKLHRHSLTMHCPGAGNAEGEDTAAIIDSFLLPLPTLGRDAWLLPLVKEVANKTAIACYIALCMTNIGHEITSFISEGLPMLASLTTSHQYTSAIHVLGCVVPIFLDSQQYLSENVVFTQVVQSIVCADESLFKTTKSAIMKVEFPGIVTQQFTEMIQAQITNNLSTGKADLVISFWLKVLFKVSRHFTCRNSCYVADTIIRWIFVKKGVMDLILDVARDQYQKLCTAAKDQQSAVTSVLQWLASSSTALPSYMDAASLPEFPWLAYVILCVEGDHEVNSRLWQTVVQQLHLPARYGVDHSLKRALELLNLEQAPSLGRLVIYRWAQQALDTPLDHPLLPILWQRFFALYLGRQVYDPSVAQRASVGERFFENMSYSGMLKRMRKRLSETSKFHMAFDPQKRANKHKRPSSLSPATPPHGRQDEFAFDEATSSSASPVPEDDLSEYSSNKEFHQMLAHLYQTYSLWLEEPRLHDANLYLPALPPQYEGMRLNQVFQGFMGPWLEFVDLDGVQYTLSCLAADWRKRLTCVTSSQVSRKALLAEPENATKRIIRRLGRYDAPKPAPALQAIQCPVPTAAQSVIEDQTAITHLVRSDLDTLAHFTKIFSTRRVQHCALDSSFIELVPRLYKNVAKTVTLTVPCRSKVNPLHKCANPAVIPVKIEEEELQEPIHRQMDQNRVEHKQLMIEALLPTPPNLVMAAVHTENVITQLIKLYQNQPNAELREIGCALFFLMTGMVCEDTDLYPPTKQFLTSCIEILGQQFVSQDVNKMGQVLQLCLDREHLAGLVSPHFDPNICTPSCLLDMYGQLVHVLQSQTVDLVFMLLSKFDIGKCLTSGALNDGQRKRLIEILGSALMGCGAEVQQSCRMVFGIYLSHLTSVLQSNFPSNLYSVFEIVLQGSSTEQLSTEVWEILLKTCFSDVIENTGPCSSVGGELASSKRPKCVDMRLSTAQVKELLDWLSSYLMHARVSDSHLSAYGLLVRWGRYASYASFLMEALLRGYTVKVIKGAGDMNPYHVMELLWQPLVAVFSPWIQPLATSPDVISAPWLEADDALANIVVHAFGKSVFFMYKEMNDFGGAGCGSGILALLLMYYMTCISTKATTDNVASVFHTQLKKLPWKELRPDLRLIEAMTQVREVASPACFSLVAMVMPQIRWVDVLVDFRQHYHPDIAASAELGLAILLIQGHLHPVHGEDEEFCRLLAESLMFDWFLLSEEGFTSVCRWFLQLCEPRCVLAERSSNLALGLRLLKRMSGFHTDAGPWSKCLSSKRQSFIHCLVQLLCQLTYRTGGVTEEQFGTVIVNLMSEVEAVACTVTLLDQQREESTALLKQILGLLNNCNPEGPWLSTVESSITGWLRESPHSLLLVPCICAASNALASLAHMAAVMEAAIEAYFSGLTVTDITDSFQGWPVVVAMFQVPELNQAGYVQEALSQSAFLMLYTYLWDRRRRHNHLTEKTDGGYNGGDLELMSEILDWTAKAQPGPEDDAKLVLWWHFLLQLATEQIRSATQGVPSPGGTSVSGTINILTRFVDLLVQIGQERTGKGLLAAIGFGRRSPISPRMRLLARALAAYLSLRVNPDGNNTRLHLDPTAKRFPTHPGASHGADLVALRRNKSYSNLTSTLDEAVSQAQDSSKTLLYVVSFLGKLAGNLFPEKGYLYSIVSSST